MTKGWTQSAHGGPIEIEVANEQLQLVTQGSLGVAIPALGDVGLLALVLALAGAGVTVILRRR